MRLVGLIIMCLNNTFTKVQIVKHLSYRFPIQNYPKQRPLNIPLEHTIREAKNNQTALKQSGTHKLLV